MLEARRPRLRRARTGLGLPAALTVLLLGGGCGSDAEPAEAPARVRAAQPPTDPLSAIPREQLYGASPAENVQTPRYELEILDLPRGWDGGRFAILSDFQLGLWEGNDEVAAAAIQRALELQPDAILLLGDYVARGDDPGRLATLLAPLRGRRVLAVLGDRDVRSDSIETRITGTLTAAGVQVLKNSAVSLERNGESIVLAGLDPDITARTFSDQQFILATLTPPGSSAILLTHLPALASRAPMARYPIIIGGNTFCGRVEVPGTPRISWLENEALPNASIEGVERLYRVQGSTLLVTCGVGYGFVPLRFGAAPEVALLTIVRLPSRPEIEAPEEVPDTLLDRFRNPPADTTVNG